jgi:hypothetical protein
MTIYTGFVQLTDLPDGFLEQNSIILTEQERIYSGAMTDWLQRSEWRCGRILLRHLITSAYDVPVSDITIHSLSSGQLVAETPAGQVYFSHARIPGVWVGATTDTYPIGVDLVNVSDFPVDIDGAERSAEDWAGVEALAKLTSKGLAWALTTACYPVDSLITTPDGNRFRTVNIEGTPEHIHATLLTRAEKVPNVVAVDLLANLLPDVHNN